MSDEFLIRSAKLNDCLGMANAHVNSWKETYKGIIDQSYLEGLSIHERLLMWKKILSAQRKNQFQFVVEAEERVVGFASCGFDEQNIGEIHAIYLLQKYQGLGVGKKLFLSAMDELKKNKVKAIHLWVLQDNKTLGFYQNMGGEIVETKEEEIGDRTYTELRLNWKI